MSSTATGPAWSAAFISWVIGEASKKAGGNGLRFPYSANHMEYSQQIRLNSNIYPFEIITPLYYDVRGYASILRGNQVKRGDIVVSNRGLNNLTMNSPIWQGEGHGDIAVSDGTPSNTGFPNRPVNLVGGNLGGKVIKYELSDFRNNPRTERSVLVILRPTNATYANLIAETALAEYDYWIANRWTTTSAGAIARVNDYKRFVNIPTSTTRPRTTSAETGTRTSVTPYIASLESFHPNIQQELITRRFASNTAQTYTPYVKLTSLLYVADDNLSDAGTTSTNKSASTSTNKSAWCPTLGVHEKDDLLFEDIYSTAENNRSLIGYATSIKNGIAMRVPVRVTENDLQFDAPNIPPAGIVSMTTERSTVGPMGVRGGLFKANVKIVAYSVGQLNALMKYFMRPATRVVLEYGRTAANDTTTITPYNWVKNEANQPRTPSSITDDPDDGFKRLITLETSQRKFIQKYVYNNFGNYEIFIGYVVKFTIKYGKNNTYEIDLTIHSVQQFEIPAKHTGAKPLCKDTESSVGDPCKVLDVHEYFDDTLAARKENSFSKLLASATGDTRDADSSLIDIWGNHVIPIRTITPPSAGTGDNGANNPAFGSGIGGYFISWKFFVNVVLNDPKRGLLSLFDIENNPSTTAYIKSNFIKPIGSIQAEPSSDKNSLLANEVGYNSSLRSTNAGVMIIYNSSAQETTSEANERISILREAVSKKEESTDKPSDINSGIFFSISENSSVGDFLPGGNSDGLPGTSFLTRGVWLNTNAIKQAFMSADTVSAGITNLLNYMNSSVNGYWNLQLISNDTENPGLHVIDTLPKFTDSAPQSTSGRVDTLEILPQDMFQSVTDVSRQRETLVGSRRTVTISDAPLETIEVEVPKYVYVFNAKTKQFTQDDTGSELIDINISFDLPQVVAVQAIANIGGVAQRGTLNAIDVDELRNLSLIPQIYATCNPPKSTNVCPSDERRLEVNRAALNTSQSIDKLIEENPNEVAFVREYGYLGESINLVEFNPPEMLRKVDSNSRDRGTVHPFNSSNLTKSIVDLTMPGIGGIQLFQTFAVDRIPQILKRGVYVVTKVSHEFTVQSGWVTKIQGRFRYKPQDD